MSPLQIIFAAVGVLMLASSAVNAQTIFPPVVEGQVGDSVSIMCVAAVSNLQNALEIRTPGSAVFVNYETTADAAARLTRVDSNVNTTLTSYTLRPLRLEDNGTVFRCSPQAGADTTVLNVLFAPVITRLGQQEDPVQVTEGEMLSVTFNVTGNPFPIFMWTRDGQMVMNGSGLTASASSLMLNPADRQHAGMYRLVVTNSIGTADYNVTLDVLYGPEFPAEFIMPNNLNNTMEGIVFVFAANPGQDVTLLCDAIGNPTPNVVRSIPTGSPTTTTNNNIVITGAMTANAGDYSCTAGNVVRRFRFYVGGPPVPISMIRIDFDSDNVNFNWTYDNSVNGVPATYFILNITLNATRVVNNTIPANILTIIARVPLSDLMINTNYSASVVVRNLQGDSEAVFGLFTTPPSGSIMISASWGILSLLLLAYVMCY